MNALARTNSKSSESKFPDMLKLARTLTLGHSNDLILEYLIATLAVGAVTYVCFLGGEWVGQDGAIMLYFAATYLLAHRSTLGPALWACILSVTLFDYFITPPLFQFDFSHGVTFATMLVLILIASRRTARIKEYASSLEDMVAQRTNELEASNKKLSEEVARHELTEHKLRKAVVELGRSNAMLQQFARVASHDLQEPLRVIQGYVGLLNSRYTEVLDDKGKEFIHYIDDGTRRMEGLVKGILEHATISNSTKRMEIVPVEAALQDACANLSQRIEETGATITNDQLPILHINKIQITQLFQNLIGNALKFQDGDRTLKIHIAYKKTSTHHRFAVEDNGIGIAPQYQAQIFEMFKRLHSSKYPGNGLGLAICKAIIDQHRGRIWVESKPGVGSRFCFEIPATDTTKA